MSARLWLLEVRRTPALWLVPPLLVLCFRTYGDRFTPPVPLWILTSVAIGQAATIIGPPLGGIAAWVAGRERRRDAGELLATTAHPALVRLVPTWAATTGWGLLIYAFFALGGGVATARRATWGGPDPWIILAGAAAIAAYTAIGFAVGAAVPGRFVAPFVALGLLIGQHALVMASWSRPALAPWKYLSPVAAPDPTVWFGGRPAIASALVLVYLGVTGIVWALLALRVARKWATRAWLALALALIPLLGGTAQALARVPPDERTPNGWYSGLTPVPYTPVCRAAPVEVCVHPAYRPWLDQLAAELNTLLAPLVGVPGMPARAEQAPPAGPVADAARSVPFPLDYRNLYSAEQYAVECAVFGCAAGFWPVTPSLRTPGGDAREAIARWLRLRLGRPPEGPYSRYCFAPQGQDTPCAASERFAALPPEAQHAWLVAHFADLRAGRLTLGDLP